MEQINYSAHVIDLFPSAVRAKTLRKMRMRCYMALGFLDSAALLLGFLVAGSLRFDSVFQFQAMTWFLAVLPLFLVLNGQNYNATILKNWRAGFATALGALLSAILIILFLGFALKATVELSRLLLLYGMVGSASFMLVFRVGFGRIARGLFPNGTMTRILVVDSVDVVRPYGVELIAIERIVDAQQLNNPFILDQLARRLEGVDSVAVACPPARRVAWALALKGTDLRAELIVPELDEIGIVGQHHVAGLSAVLVSSGPMGWRDRMLKRGLDVSIAALALIALSPLMILVAIAIKLDSAGPVLFRQERVGYGNRLFSVFKFRSMRIETADHFGTRSASRDDARITRVGRFIRATSVDELPQLINVLRGQMSVVGPRPHALGSLAGNELFWEVDVRYHHRHACKPGLTGLAQVRGFRGATHRRDDLINRLQADLEYLNGWSIVRDLTIIVSTFKVIVHRNAY